jgi:tetratricopeptide (TPR) repeat protein
MKIEQLFAIGELERASEEAFAAILEFDRQPQFLEIAGFIEFERGNQGVARDLFQEIVLVAPMSQRSSFALARIYVNLGRIDEARILLDFQLERLPKVNCQFLAELAIGLSRIQRDEDAVMVCEEALYRHPYDARAAFGVAFYRARSGACLATIRTALALSVDLDPNNPVYRINLASVCFDQDDMFGAYEHACSIAEHYLSKLTSGCLLEKMRSLFSHFSDSRRLALIN